jgi:hypothetical protein
MAYRIEKNQNSGQPEIVIDGFEQGIADSSYEGIADIRNINIVTAPKQANVMFANTAVTLPPSGYTGVAFSSDSGTDVFTVASTTGFYNGMALTIVTVSGAGSGTAGQTYYVGNITPTTFKLYDDLLLTTVLDVTDNRTGTFTVYTFGTPVDSASDYDYNGPAISPASLNASPSNTFVLTSEGYVWFLRPIANTGTGGIVAMHTLQFLGNLTHSTSAGTPGIAVWNGYLFAFMSSKIDYLSINYIITGRPSSGWVMGWQDTTGIFLGHRAIPATDDALYFCNNTTVGSILVNAGSSFNPANAGTYTYNTSALKLPAYDKAVCLAQLGTNLLVGGVKNFVYPWDRVSTSYTYPLILPENYVKCIVSTNSNAYIFAGYKGRIYITNGANIEEYKELPGSLSGTVEPYYTWRWGLYWRNQLYFTFTATTNSGTAIDTFNGLWAIDLESKSFRFTNMLSTGTYAGSIPTIIPMGQPKPTGDGIYSCWVSGATTGIDYTSGTPYTDYQAYIDTDIIPVGTYLTKTTFSNIEYKLAKPLVSGEGVKLYQRSNLTDSFVEIGEDTTVGNISYPFTMNFENVQWLQIRAMLKSTATTPSYVPLLELRIR